MLSHYLPRISRFFCLLMAALAVTACATFDLYKSKDGQEALPPVLSQDEVIRPYVNLGRIQVTIDLYISQSPDLHQWGYRALREEAARLGADAVMLPELSSRPAPHLVIPAQEYRATGVAIRFK